MEAWQPRIYLRTGDRIVHTLYEKWGEGLVVEEKHSSLPGGMCMVKASFQDGEERSFINDLDNDLCCYFTGIRVIGA